MKMLRHAGTLATLLICSAPLFSQSSDAPPPDLRLAMRKATAPPEFAVVAGSDGLRWSADNRAHGLRAGFSGEAVSVVPIDGGAASWNLNLQLVGVGRTGHLSAPVAAQAAADGARLGYRRGSLVEWYLNLPQGLEQGFTIEQAPAGDPSTPIELRLGVGGTLTARPLADGTGVALCAEDGTERLSYTGLAAWDAAGQPLACWMEPAEGAIVISVDDRGAHYPVTVDPFIGTGVRVLTSTDSAMGDYFGWSVALSGDTALIGTPQDTNVGGVLAGSVYVFRRSASGWTEQSKLIASDASDGARFGSAVALAGDTAVIGARGASHAGESFAGLAYVFVRTEAGWSEQARLAASDASSFDYFGHSVALSGERALIGAFADDNAAVDAGSAYAFVRNGSSWSEEAKLLASDAAFYAHFGTSVALSGDTALVGADLADAPGKQYAGAAYVFVRTGSTWSEQARLLASDASAGDEFGSAVALSGSTALVGAPYVEHDGVPTGSVYVFEGDGTVWSEQTRLSATDASARGFGTALALSEKAAVIGATYGVLNPAVEAGSAYLFERNGTTWTPHAKIVPPDAQGGADFGSAVAVSGHTALLGAPFDDHGSVVEAGTAYVYDWADGTRWTASDAGSGDEFGVAVALSGDSAIVGAPGVDLGTASGTGSAYVFVRNGDTWSEQAKLTASDAASGDMFGLSVALSGDTAVVGALQDDHSGAIEAGSAYVFVRTGTSWTEQAKLTASTASYGLLGLSVAVSGDTAVVGARRDDLSGTGMGYVFVRSGTTWSEQAELTATDAASGAWLGKSASISGDTVVLGAPHAGQPGAGSCGAAYVFVRQGTSWSQQAKLVAADADSGDALGQSVSISGDTVIAGAIWDDHFSVFDAGSAYVFDRTGTSWTQTARLEASEPATLEWFGSSVCISGGTAIVGAQRHIDGSLFDAGAAYVFVRGADGWGEWLGASWSEPQLNEWLGLSVAVEGDTFLAGAPGSDAAGPDLSGAAYVGRVNGDWIDLGYGLPGTTGTPNLSGSGILAGGSKATLSLAHAKPSALGMLFVSQLSAPVPFKGGTLVPFPPLLSFVLVTQPDGSLPIAFTWPGGVPANTAIWFQYAIADLAAVQHVALSNALKATTP